MRIALRELEMREQMAAAVRGLEAEAVEQAAVTMEPAETQAPERLPRQRLRRQLRPRHRSLTHLEAQIIVKMGIVLQAALRKMMAHSVQQLDRI